MHGTSNPILTCASGPAIDTGGWIRIVKALGALTLSGFLLGTGTIPATAAGPTYSVTIAWDQSPETTVIGYRAHYGVASRSYPNVVDAGNVTSVTLSNLAEGTTYYFAVTAYDVFGQESDFSEELSYVPGTPTMRARILSGGQASLMLRGRINQAYAVEATATFNNWTVIATVTMGANGTYEFTDNQVALFTRRFYRLRDLQP